MKDILEKKLHSIIEELQEAGTLPVFDIPEIKVERPKDDQFGEYATNVALMLSKVAKKNPLELAELIKEKLISNDFALVEVVKPGYINFYFSNEYFQSIVTALNKDGASSIELPSKKEKVMVEYSQPNTHKEFHIGHLRNVFIGSAIVNTLRKSGQEVIAANYIGDTGTHIAKCLWGLTKFYADYDLDNEKNKAEFLGKVYSEATQKIEENPDYEMEFKALQKKFESGDRELVSLWEKTKQWSMDEFERIYKELDIVFDTYFFESVEEEAGKKLLPELLEKGVVEKSEGAIVANLEKYDLGVLVLVRKDGSALYGLKDIPLAKEKFEKYSVDTSIIVVDIRQSLYFKQLFKILELYGFHKKMLHYGYEFVALKGGESMSSRKGNVIPARFLIDTVTEKVKAQFPESPNPKQIALGAIRFAMLKNGATSKIEFDIDESVKLEGATGPYVQYAHARLCSILRKSEEEGFHGEGNLSLLIHPKERELIRELMFFPELIEAVAADYGVHRLPQYAMRLADRLHSFYDECRVLDAENKELSAARLQLIQATKIVLAETLELMGIAAPEKM